MKYAFPAMLVCVALCLSGCSENAPTTTDIASAIVSDYGYSSDSGILYVSGCEEYDKGYLSEKTASLIYCGGEESPDGFSFCSEYAVYISSKAPAFEVHVFKLNNASDRTAVEKMLSRRAGELFSGVYINGVEYLGVPAGDVCVTSKGKYVVMIAADDCEKGREIVKKMI